MKKKWLWQILFSWAQKSLQMVIAAMKLKETCSLEEKAMTNLDCILKSRDITLLTKVCIIKAIVFPGGMYGCESWTVKKPLALTNQCFQTVVLEKTLESLLDSKEIKPVMNLHWKD